MAVKYTGTQAKKYLEYADSAFSWTYLERPVLESYIKPLVSRESKVLDAGCGAGRSTRFLLDVGFKAENITASDISPELLETAQEVFPSVTFIESDLVHLTFPDQHFGLILSVMVLHYLNEEELRQVVHHFSSWLKPGGVVCFIVAHPLRFAENHTHYFEKQPHEEKTPWGTTIEYYPKKVSDYVQAIIDSGLELIKVDEPQPVPTAEARSQKNYQKYATIPTRLAILAKKTS